jgi:hypothetical protein
MCTKVDEFFEIVRIDEEKMATKNNRRTLITKKILKESLLELMQEKPVSKITIKEICDLSEMSRSTF